MTAEDPTPTPSPDTQSTVHRWRDPVKRVGVTVIRFFRSFANDDDSPLADLRTALGHVQPARVLWGLGALGLLGYLSTGIFSVAPGEAAVVRRFGSVIQPLVEPGLHYRLPWPIDRLDIINVSNVRREQIGVLTPEKEHAHPEPPSKLQALSGDTNVIDVEVIVQYQVRDPVSYLFNVKYAPYRTVRDALRAAVTKLVTVLPVDALLTSGRQSLQKAIRAETQNILDSYRSGLTVIGIDLQKAFPPADVAAAFIAVNTAREEKARQVNEARGYMNSLVPEARGEAQRIRAQAQAYRSNVIARANGDARAFEFLLAEYRKNSAAYGDDVTRYRMYLDTIEKILPQVQIYALDKTQTFNLRLFGDKTSDPIAVNRQAR